MIIDFNNIEYGYFISVVHVDDFDIEKGLIEEPIIGKNSQYYFVLGDNFDSSDIYVCFRCKRKCYRKNIIRRNRTDSTEP